MTTPGSDYYDYTPNITKGAAWLDEHRKGWLDRVDPDRLDMVSCVDCVLGQLDGNYDDAGPGDIPRDPMQSFPDSPKLTWAIDHGFNVGHGHYSGHDELTEQWRLYIRNRRDPAQENA